MEDPSSVSHFSANFLQALIKSVGGGIGFAFTALEAKKAWKKEQKWKLAMAFGSIIFGIYIIFVGI